MGTPANGTVGLNNVSETQLTTDPSLWKWVIFMSASSASTIGATGVAIPGSPLGIQVDQKSIGGFSQVQRLEGPLRLDKFYGMSNTGVASTLQWFGEKK